MSHPTFSNGKICYIEIPAIDVEASADFYRAVFDWHVRTRDDGSVAFDDGAGEVSGTWVKGRVPETDPTLVVHIMVDNMDEALDAIVQNGGKIVRPVGADHPEITASFSDPAGNVFGLYQHRGE